MDGCSKRGQNYNINDYFEIDNEVKPGFCDPYTGCPEPTEVVCLKVDKVFEECKLADVNTVDIDLTCHITGDIKDVKCIKAEIIEDKEYPRECEILPCQRVRSVFYYKIKFKWKDDKGWNVHTSDPIKVEKIIRLKRAGEQGLEPYCEIFLDLIDCFPISKATIRCCVGKLILFKLFANVQLLVPAYGYCPPPKKCEEEKPIDDECPDVEEWLEDIEWPPFYPEQIRPILPPVYDNDDDNDQ